MKTRKFYLGLLILISFSFFFFSNFTFWEFVENDKNNSAFSLYDHIGSDVQCPTEVAPINTAEQICSGMIPTVPDDATILASVDLPDNAVVQWTPSPDIALINDGADCDLVIVDFQYQITCTEDPNVILEGGNHTVEVYPAVSPPDVIAIENPNGGCDFAFSTSCFDEALIPIEEVIPGQFVDIPVTNDAGCENTFTIQIPECPYLIHVSPVEYAILCNEYTASFTVEGGTGNYTVNGMFIPGNTYTSNPIDCGQPYTFNVSDGTPVNDIFINGPGPDCPEEIVIFDDIVPLTIATIEIEITLDGGTPPYSVDGDAIDGNVYHSGPIDCGQPYTFTVTDINECDIQTVEGETTCPCEIPLTATSHTVGLIGTDYAIQATIQGGSGSYSVNGMPTNGNTYILPLTPCDQDYSIIIVDELGCGDYTIQGSSPCPPPFTITEMGSGSVCDEYTTQFVISGGSGNYLVDDIPIAGNIFISDLIDCGEPYTFTVVDNISDQQAFLTGESPECPEPLDVTELILPISEGFFVVQLDITGGSPPYSINGTEIEGITFTSQTINCGKPYTFTVIDDEGCDVLPIEGTTPDCSDEIVITSLETGFVCNEYTTQFVISGGSGNYLVDDIPVPGNLYISDPMDCGEPYAFAINDDIASDVISVSGDSPDCPTPITVSSSVIGIMGDRYILLLKMEGGTGNYQVNDTEVAGPIYVEVLPCYQNYAYEISDENACDVVFETGNAPCYIEDIANFGDPNGSARVFVTQEELKAVADQTSETYRKLLEPLRSAFEQAPYLFIFNNPIGENEVMTIHFSLPQQTQAILAVRDINGRIIRILSRQSYTKGSYNIDWDGRSQYGQTIPAGLYFIELQTEMGRIMEKVVKTNR